MKLTQWLLVMVTTRTLHGPRLGFQLAYLIHTILTILTRLKITKGGGLRKRFEEKFDREMIIQNQLGLFSINPKNDSLTKSITSFEIDHQAWLDADQRKKTFIDIGANIGFYSILAIKRYGYSGAIAFEPNPETYTRLTKNLELNALTEKVRLSPYGLSDKAESALLTTIPTHTGASTFVQKPNKTVETVSVLTTTFDTIVTEYAINPQDISFIKIDVEGFEHRVLRGMKDTLPLLSPGTCLFIEIHPRDAEAENNKSFIESYGFKLTKTSPQNNFLYIKQ
jgi:FkbM family methyltransferase